MSSVPNYYTKAIAEALIGVRPGQSAWFWCVEHRAGQIGVPTSAENPHVEVEAVVRRVIADGSWTHWIDTTTPMRLSDYQGTVGALGYPVAAPAAADMHLATRWLCEQHRMRGLHGHD